MGLIRGVVFDLFHTLVDPEDYRPKDFRRVEILAGMLNVDRKEFSEYWEKTASLRYSTNRASIEYVKDFCVSTGKTPSEQLLASADEAIGRYQDLAILNPRDVVIESLKLLKESGLKLGLLSNAEEREVRSWQQSPLSPFFHFAAFSYATGQLKPDPAAYESVLNGLEVDAGSCAYAGDGGSQELTGARRAGFSRIFFMKQFVTRNGIHKDDDLRRFSEQADFVIEDFRELPSQISILNGP